MGYNLHAQIKGDIKDIDGKPVIAATVVLIKSYDSSIVHSASFFFSGGSSLK
ncbi:MAG: hypothetical protein H0V91_13530 [Flavisolibacter sp.]|nr:hypothetical protein [Flavisolibacter sp.]